MDPIFQDIKSRYPDLTKGDLIQNLTLQRAVKTKILQVGYKDESEEKILFILNNLMTGYLDYQAKEYISNLSQAQEFTEEQINRVIQEVALLESQLESFQKEKNLIDPATQNNVLAQQSEFLNKEIEDTEIQLDGMTQLAKNLQSQLDLTPEEGVIVTRLNQEQNYSKLISQIKDIESQIALESIRLGEQHPTLRSLNAKKQELVSLLYNETRKILGPKAENLSLDFLTSISNNLAITQKFFDTNSEIAVLKAKRDSLNDANQKFNKEINVLSTTNKEYYQIQRELKTANDSLNRLLALNENLQIEVAKQASPWKLLTPINDSLIKDISGTARKIGLIAFGSLCVGGLIGLLVDKLDSAFHSVEELQNTLDLPCLGIIPYNSKLELMSKRQTGKLKKGTFKFAQKSSEEKNDQDEIINLDSYISLYTNINLLSSDTSIRSIVIGAAEASEGKSTTSIYLARAAAMLGKRVLVVDVDMRKPKVHQYLGLKNTTGLSNLIADDVPINDAIQESKIENLSIISAGSKPPNPTRIISSQKMQTLMKTLRQNFDFVIYDTPPLMGFSDAKILIPFTEGLVFIVGLGKTHRPNVKRVINDLQMSKMSVLGMVANGVKNYMGGYYGYGYYDYNQYYKE
ncbi:tyrosine-protein kinase EpsD [Geminocystis sp. NIES-3709]|nr:tyrosine-protein kinase EpsD [Geminocystis sp. NIES-3709]